MRYDLKCLACPLPEDVLKLKYFGDLDRLNRVIAQKLEKDIPQALKERLRLEKEIMALWPRAYPHDEETALRLLRDAFGDFSAEELETLRDDDAVEWAYINGQVRYKNNFLLNLVKTRKNYARRLKKTELLDKVMEKAELLNGCIQKMKEKGTLGARFHIRTEMTISVPPQRAGQEVCALLPVPIEYAQVKNFQLLELSHSGAVLAPADYPQRTVCFRAVPDRPFFVDYTFETHTRYMNPNPQDAAPQQPTFYTEEYPPHIVFTPYLRMLCREIVGDETNPLLKARRIYDFITTKMIYSFMRSYMTMPNVPEYGASSMKGDCGVQALLFITLCRLSGVPARWQSGVYVAPEDAGIHDWAQFYVAPFGWLFADPSFGGSAYREGDMERWNFYFGNLDPFRMPANSEYQHDFFIPSRHLRYDPYDNQDGEAEWDDAPVPIKLMSTTHQVLSMEWLEE